jgi:hypothetical protein
MAHFGLPSVFQTRPGSGPSLHTRTFIPRRSNSRASNRARQTSSSATNNLALLSSSPGTLTTLLDNRRIARPGVDSGLGRLRRNLERDTVPGLYCQATSHRERLREAVTAERECKLDTKSTSAPNVALSAAVGDPVRPDEVPPVESSGQRCALECTDHKPIPLGPTGVDALRSCVSAAPQGPSRRPQPKRSHLDILTRGRRSSADGRVVRAVRLVDYQRVF